ncbi:hypothetical protein GRX03_08750 [Halovenus sp. WSH3]|uniref:Uncharacterized protein n=1 Tax=Halovenus carboxidivorans TaxID=2692199 RepID=A0A6B0TEQ6_9EURY|nr:hypothetical protein [Halovenus carboxidivorans]MXR51689.1 hypothetical protein [Halovenus carboxidivorans]
MSRLPDIVLMPVDDDSEYVKHVYAIVLFWTALVIIAGIGLAMVALLT